MNEYREATQDDFETLFASENAEQRRGMLRDPQAMQIAIEIQGEQINLLTAIVERLAVDAGIAEEDGIWQMRETLSKLSRTLSIVKPSD